MRVHSFTLTTTNHQSPPVARRAHIQPPPSSGPSFLEKSASSFVSDGSLGIDQRESLLCSYDLDPRRSRRNRYGPCAAGEGDDSDAVASWRRRYGHDAKQCYSSSSDVANRSRDPEAATDEQRRTSTGVADSPETDASPATTRRCKNINPGDNPVKWSLCDVPAVRRTSYGRVDGEFLRRLRSIVGDANVTTNRTVLEQHGRDESYHEAVPPDAVAFARSTHQVQQLVTACAAARVPIIPYGAGTSLEGHVAALCGGVSIDLSQMNEVVEVHAEDMDCRVQAGVTRQQLNHHLHDSGLFFPVDPGSECTIGGMTATRASGTNAVRYGTMREAVLGVTAVLPNGQIIKTGSRARKSSSGYDLTRLIVGSEGTLALVTEVALRLYPQPEAVSAAVCPFTSIAGAVDTVIETIQTAIPVARIELLDEVQVEAVNRYSKTHLQPSPTLFFEFHGTAAAVEEQAKQVSEIASGNGGGSFEWSTAPEERSKLWAARHSAYYAALALRPNSKGLLADVCVPISRLTELVVLAKQQIQQAQLVAPIVGHVGDGNFHVLFIVDPDNKDELAAVKRVNDSLVARAIAVGGTCSGEHGVGYGKLPFLESEHGSAALDAMAALKAAWDPLNLFNPGKLGQFRLP
ncbi:unnamed protein product [Closterium sp. Yama58-4]|nr:unnamed protein product [Closterium sp. Yama58-4]